MQRLISTILAAAFALTLAPAAIAQGAARPVDPVLVDPVLVERALAYLNGVRTLQARFVQRDQAGGQWTGRLWLARPGRVRFQYDPPEGDVIWSSGGLVKHYDARLDALTHLPPSETPAWFLLDDQVRVGGDVKVLATALVGQRYFLTASQNTMIAEGRVTLAFRASPEQILGWTVTDDAGAVTQVDLIDVVVGGDIPDEIFEYQPPVDGG